MKRKYLEIGKIVNTHGLDGEVKIIPWADSPQALLDIEIFYIDEKPVRLIRGRIHKGTVLATLEGVSDVNAAMRLKNKTVFIDRDDIELEDGAFFIQDIIGAEVVDERGAKIGVLAEVLEKPSSNVYVISGEREILVPAVPEFILGADVENGVITVRLLEGM